MLTRRSAFLGLLAAPAIIRTPGLLMPVKIYDETDVRARHLHRKMISMIQSIDGKPILGYDYYSEVKSGIAHLLDNGASISSIDIELVRRDGNNAVARFTGLVS